MNDSKTNAQHVISTMRTILVERTLSVILGIIILVAAHFLAMYVKDAIYQLGARRLSDYLASHRGNSNSNSTDASAPTPAAASHAPSTQGSDGGSAFKDVHAVHTQVSNASLIYVSLATMSYWLVMVVAALIVLRVIGVEAASIIAIVGAISFAIGLAVQGTLTDISSGIVLAILQYYTIGDIIELEDQSGYVREFNLISTVVEDLLTRAYVNIPNRRIQEAILRNHTRLGKRMVVFEILLSNKNKDWNSIVQLIRRVVTTFPNINLDPAPIIGVSSMADVGTSVRVRAWIDAKHYPLIIVPLQTAIRQALADSGVEMTDPF